MSEQGWIFVLGIFVAILSYFAKILILEPLLEFRKVKGRIQNSLRFNANKIFNDVNDDMKKQLIVELRKLSCDLEEAYCAMSFRNSLGILKIIPTRKDLIKISESLMYISNSINDIESNGEKHEFYDTIKKKLKIL